MTAPFLLASLHLAVRNVPGCGDAAPSLRKRLFVSELCDDIRLKVSYVVEKVYLCTQTKGCVRCQRKPTACLGLTNGGLTK